MGSTHKLLSKLSVLSGVEVGGIPGVAVECVDIGRNTSGEGDLLVKNKSGYGTIKVSIQTFFVWQGGYYLDFFPRGTGWDTFFGKMLYILL